MARWGMDPFTEPDEVAALPNDVAAAQDVRVDVRGNATGSAIVVGNGNIVTVTYAAEMGRPHDRGDNPYRGLDAFDERSHDLFFGRTRIVKDLLKDMKRLAASRAEAGMRLLAIMGPSGCGKSSIARAGLVPALASYTADEAALWHSQVIVTRPGHSPLDTLAGALARFATGIPDPRERQLEYASRLRAAAQPVILSEIVRECLPNREPFVIVIDQFEEVYSLARDGDSGSRAEIDSYVAMLLDAASAPDPAIYLVLTLRSDFFGALERHPVLSKAVAANHVIVPALTGDDLRAAIEQPARRRGRPFDPATVALILDQVQGEPAALPLLQFALQRIWEGETLPSFGGVVGALGTTANDILDRLARELPGSTEFAKNAFLSAVQLGDGPAYDTRRRAFLDDALPGTMTHDAAKAILAPFVEARLLATGTDPASGREWFELPHEALIRHWRKLRKWIDLERDQLRFHRRVGEATTHWEDEGRPDGTLWRPPDLTRLQTFHAQDANRLNARELAFLDRSKPVYHRARRVRRGTIAAGIPAIILFFATLAVEERYKNNKLQAGQSRLLAFLSRREAESGNGMAAVLLALEALPRNLVNPDRPFVREAELALQFAVSSNRELRKFDASHAGVSANVIATAFQRGRLPPLHRVGRRPGPALGPPDRRAQARATGKQHDPVRRFPAQQSHHRPHAKPGRRCPPLGYRKRHRPPKHRHRRRAHPHRRFHRRRFDPSHHLDRRHRPALECGERQTAPGVSVRRGLADHHCDPQQRPDPAVDQHRRRRRAHQHYHGGRNGLGERGRGTTACGRPQPQRNPRCRAGRQRPLWSIDLDKPATWLPRPSRTKPPASGTSSPVKQRASR